MADVKEESKRYPLLEFEYDKGPYEKTLELSNQPGFCELYIRKPGQLYA